MKARMHHKLPLILVALIAISLFSWSRSVAAQEPVERVQQIAGRLRAGEIDVYLLEGQQPGERLSVTMQTRSGNLDPFIGIIDTSIPLEERIASYQADLQSLLAENVNVTLALEDLRNQYFLAWNDDGGDGYGAALEYDIPAAGDYMLLAGGSLSTLGRATFGDYALLLGLNAPGVLTGQAQPTGTAIAEQVPSPYSFAPTVEETAGSITAETPVVNLGLVDIQPGETLYIYVEPTSGNLVPAIILRDFGNKPLEAGNLTGQEPQAVLQYSVPDGAVGYSFDVQSAPQPDGTVTTGEFRVLVGENAPEILTGQILPQGDKVLETAIEVQVGLKINRISAVNSQDENFTAIANLRMDWTDPALAFSPDSCDCTVKVYTEKEFDSFLVSVGSRWPGMTFFNQLGNRWIQGRSAAIWPDGRARYAELFSTTFQADFNFQKYPFDTQTFPIFLDMLFPTDVYTLVDLPGYSTIDPEHGEDEFIITDFVTSPSVVTAGAAERPVARMTFSFSSPRHLNYYVLQVFVPILLIILISWFTFFLKDYSRRIEAAAANILLFIAFNFTLADNYPRLGYVTFLDAVMAVTFLVNVLVLLYNVNMKRLETEGKDERVARIDNILDWLYPLLYIALIGIVVLIFL